MMTWLPMAMSIFGGVVGYQGGREMEKLGRDQEKQAEENALFEKKELQEQVRRQEDEDQRLRSAALARGAASGATISGSIADYLGYMEDEQTRQLNWTKTAGASRIRLNLQAAKSQAEATKIRGETQKWTSLFSGVGHAAAYGDRAGVFGTTKP